MKISKFQVTVEPWRYSSGMIELRWKIIKGNGIIYEKKQLFCNQDDFKSLFDSIWDQAKHEFHKKISEDSLIRQIS